MTDTQLYLVIGIPTIAVVVGMSGNALLFLRVLEARMLSLEMTMDRALSRLEQRFDCLFARI